MALVRSAGMVAAAALALVVCIPAPARAADEEIQVYQDEMSGRGKFGLDIHTNWVASGDSVTDYPGQQVSLHRLRVTPEWSYGISDTLDLGLYLPLNTLDRDGRLRAAGVKGRIKFIAPAPQGRSWFWGANLEIGRVSGDLDRNPWNAELKGIWGVRNGRWTVALNANLGWVISGPDHSPAELSGAARISYRVRDDLSLGLESYNGFGTTSRFGHLSENEQALYGVIDKGFGHWDLNLGVGRAFGTSSDGWVMKAIVGVPIDP